ncbi:hypothetical protein ABS735_26525 [Streptomyces sp. MMCC 100]|uniref:hypothetical protein n=1 Tax=Streptomyces sp. MMCC 100 TaxID=3163555 RepID=UPI003598700B
MERLLSPRLFGSGTQSLKGPGSDAMCGHAAGSAPDVVAYRFEKSTCGLDDDLPHERRWAEEE